MASDRPGIHELASREYAKAFAWYFGKSLTAAFRFEDVVEAALIVIQESPQRCPRITDEHRWILLSPFPYALIFLETGRGPYVVSVAHAKRRFGFWRRREP